MADVAGTASSAGDQAGGNDDFKLTLRLTTHPVNPVPSNHAMTVSRTASVLEIKARIAEEWEGKPKVDGIVCVQGGRVCRDAEIIGHLFGKQISERDAVLHVIVRPTAWSVPFPSQDPSSSVTPAPSPPIAPSDAAAASSSYQPTYTSTPPPAPEATPPLTTDVTPVSPADPPASSSGPASASTNSVPVTTPAPESFKPPFTIYLAHLSQLIPLQRSVLLLNLQKAHSMYAQLVNKRRDGLVTRRGEAKDPVGASEQSETGQNDDEVEEIKQVLTECKLWPVIEHAEAHAGQEIDKWESQGQAPAQLAEFQLVQINGLPFLLHVPGGFDSSYAPPPPRQAYLALRRAEAILRTLTTMLQLLITYQPTAPAIAYGRAVLTPSNGPGGAIVAAHQGLGARVGGLPQPGVINPAAIPPRRRATISIVINLEAIFSIIVPLLFLSLKLAFLLWIFGRHASHKKRMILAGMAAVWVLWEGYGMYRRRTALGQARERLERAQRRAREAALAQHLPQGHRQQIPLPGLQAGEAGLRQRNVGANQPANPPGLVAGAPPARAHGAPAAGVRPPRAPGTRARRAPPSALSPRYWIARIATIGLVEEAHELGLAPRTVAGRHVPFPTHPIPPVGRRDRIGRAAQVRRRAIRTAFVAFVLFFGTLIPEVERKRKRALEKRDRLLAEKRVQRERALERQAAAASATTTTSAADREADAIHGGLTNERVPEQERERAAQPPELERQSSEPPTSGASTPAMTFDPAPTQDEVLRGTSAAADQSGSASTLAPPASAAVDGGEVETSTPVPATPVMPNAAPPAGRAVVPDDELFADGLGEPEQAPIDTDDGGDIEAGESSEDDDEPERRADEDDGEVDQVVALF